MINYIRYLLMAFSLLGGWSSIMAQSPIDRRVIGASGGSATAGSGASAVDISFTVGETSIGNFNANGSLLTVGFQQPDVVNTAPTTTGIPNQTATVGQLLSLNIAPSFSDAETPNALQLSASGLPTGLALVGGVISGTPTAVSAASVTVVATDPGSLSVGATFTLTVSTSAVVPTGPAMLTITSFTCNTTNSVLSSVNFVVGYSDGSFAPALPPLFINGITIAGQLGTAYTFPFDTQQSFLPIQDQATRSTYFVWNFRAACSTPVTPPTPTPPVAPALANQTATQGTPFNYVVPAFGGTSPISYLATGLPTGLNFDASSRTISGTPSLTGVSTVVISASNVAGQSSGQFTLAVSASAVVPTGPATLTITSFTCNTTNSVLSSVNFVVGYSDGTFAPALAPLFINGVTVTGQLGQPYTFNFDGNQSFLPIQDQATRSTYFVWNFRDACSAPVTPPTPTPPVAPALANQTATQGTPFNYVVPTFTGTAPIVYSAMGLPAGLSFDASSHTISGTPSLTGVSTVVISASNSAGQISGQFTLTVSTSAVVPTGPAMLTITSFTCNTTNSVLSSVNFVVGYSDGSFAPALPPLFINGITIAGQLGTTYAFPFDGNQSLLPIQDQASRSTYFVWNFRAACALQLPRSRLLAENTMDWSVRLAGNPVTNEIVVDILEGAAQPLQFTLANERGYVVERRTVSPVQYLNRVVFDVHEQPAGLLLLHITSGQRTQVLKVLKR